ncbi:Hypothetical protein UVM_LOCUS316 [uncultured virus]|nr:Hypothetical protein UVM_LOCUS316 [uncultured virus]
MLRCASSYVLLARLPPPVVSGIDLHVYRLVLLAKVRRDELDAFRAWLLAFDALMPVAAPKEAPERSRIVREMKKITDAHTSAYPLLTRFDDVEDLEGVVAELRGWSDAYRTLMRVMDDTSRVYLPTLHLKLCECEIAAETGRIMQIGIDRMSCILQNRKSGD